MPEEFSFDPAKVAFALITFYPKWYRGKLRSIKHTDKIRGDLALEFIHHASKKSCHVVVVDGKSAKTFKKELSQVTTIKVLARKTQKRAPNKRKALRVASAIEGVEVIIFSEIEKVSLVTDCLEKMVKPILTNEADIVVPKRNDLLFKSTHPLYMYESETEGNRIYNEALRTQGLIPEKHEDFDMFFGPRALRNDRKIVALFMRRFRIKVGKFSLPPDFFDTEDYSNPLYFPVILALKIHLRVASVEIPFSYPTIQKENEEIGLRSAFIEKRNLQRISLIVELIHFLSYLERKPQSKMKAVK